MENRPFAKRSLGQNFLQDGTVISRIVSALDLSSDDVVFEIGPGRGALTDILAVSGAAILALELDRNLAPILSERFADNERVRIIEADVLETDFHSVLEDVLGAGPYICHVKLVANLPYYISTAILQKLIRDRGLFSSLVLMFQKEVAERITAPPGSSERGFLTVLVESAFRVEKLFDVPPGAFRPVPKVWSSVVRLTPTENSAADQEFFRRMLSAAFAQKRKTIFNNLKAFSVDANAVLSAAGIEPSRRAESLTLAEWMQLNETFASYSQI